MIKQYLAPELKVTTIELQGIIAASNEKISISDNVTENDAWMNNKLNNPWEHSWE